MNLIRKHILFFLPLFVLLLLYKPATAQVIIKGKVFDMSRTQPLSAVSVLSTSGVGTVTDSTGSYTLLVNETDSIWFSYLNKPTPKFAVAGINFFNGFDISLHVPITELKEVKIMPRSYKRDSIQNRLDYAKAFDFKKPGISLSNPSSGAFGVGLDLDAFINMFNFRKNRRMAHFQQRLIQEEQDKFIDHRFTKALVRKITRLSGPEQDDFMKKYRPSLEFTSMATDYEFAEYIKLAGQEYVKRKAF
ncbi:MAG TPA: hypothetical protein VK645_11085 [Chitinophagaceae bacterium]|nr:hypothetical protein [Chitinophagaceae bacterium]